MLYEGPNREGFERDARLFNEWRNGMLDSYDGGDTRPINNQIQDKAHELADAYGIGHAEIWDYLPEYEV